MLIKEVLEYVLDDHAYDAAKRLEKEDGLKPAEVSVLFTDIEEMLELAIKHIRNFRSKYYWENKITATEFLKVFRGEDEEKEND